ncbi:rotamase-domain-containing protein [Collybia nuda]|uniref:Peptidyl-prolyl cis-trans isomerase n=1 Tax=Collybia nuda TaxID=64659 RepID=A0A9P5YL49_9AGAR|nr:rotamase-domain-containing protein [Collybia nuda]
MSNSRGVAYFYNTTSKQSVWEQPADLTQDQINQLPGAKEYLSKAKSGGKADQVRASHLLVKHRDSRRPSSWKEPTITRSKEEAIEILRGYESTIGGSAEKFGELASQHSDCSSHANSGDLGWFGRGQMQKPFEDAAYGLQVGEISEIISSDSGVHLVLRTG